MKKLLLLIVSFPVVLLLTGCSFQNPSIVNSNLILQNQRKFDLLIDVPEVSDQKVYRKGDAVCGNAMTGWFSTHSYPELGIKIYTHDLCGRSFESGEPPFIKKNGSMLVDPFDPGQYIKVIAKNPNETIQQIFDRDYIFQFETGCKLVEMSKQMLTGKISNIEAFTVTNEGICIAGGNGMHQNYVGFFYNKSNPDRYYLYDYTDGCAPGKCNVFNEIELY